MSGATPPDEAALWRTLAGAAARPPVDAALRDLYARLDSAVAARGPTCWASGNCCRFDEYRHRLYVTALEVAWFLQAQPAHVNVEGGGAAAGSRMALPQLSQAATGGDLPPACPYQIDGLCSVREIRPMGCRVFFCEEGTEGWQQALYERFLAELRALHDRLGLPYRYLEWRAGLKEATAVLAAVSPQEHH